MKRLLRVAAVVAVLLVIGVALLASIKPQSPLSGDVANDAELVKRGEYLAVAADCKACHTDENGGKDFAGGLPLPIPNLGTIHTPNITPDAKTGIGTASLAEFDRAVRFGIGRGGANLYPAMPYVSYAKITDADIKALYAYFKYGVAAVEQPRQAGTIPWPLNMRWPLQVWNRFFYAAQPYRDKPGRDAAWNRGAYLVQGLAHCGTCHTPRGIGMQEVALDETAKGYLGGQVLAGWQAYNITSDPNAGIGDWSAEELSRYLSTGHQPGVAQAAGPMAEAVDHSFSRLRNEDIQAIVGYVKTIPAVGGGVDKPRQKQGAPSDAVIEVRGAEVAVEGGAENAAQLFIGNCATCHQWSGAGSRDGYYPSMFHNSTVGASNPINLAQVILHGINRKAGADDVSMPKFAGELSDREIAALSNFLTSEFGNPAARISEAEVKRLR